MLANQDKPVVPKRRTTSRTGKPIPKAITKPSSKRLTKTQKDRPPARTDRPIPRIDRKAGRISLDATGY